MKKSVLSFNVLLSVPIEFHLDCSDFFKLSVLGLLLSVSALCVSLPFLFNPASVSKCACMWAYSSVLFFLCDLTCRIDNIGHRIQYADGVSTNFLSCR